MKQLATSNLKLGIIAGGQLGKMLIQEASKWDIATYVLDGNENCPAANIASVFVKGSHLDFDAVYQFGKKVDILTYELENINVEALLKLKAEGLKIAPDPDVLKLIQDKGLQKDFYKNNDIPTAPYSLFKHKKEVLNAIASNQISYPFVQKLRKGGYDGRGVAIIKDEHDHEKVFEAASLVEKKVEISKEIAVIAARNLNGDIKCFPVVEMVFDNDTNIVEKLICPSKISHQQAEKATELAIKIIEKLNMVGLLAVEFFIDKKGEVIVNEVAPRPHNSGHHTIESVVTSQFEQHLRAILNLPLGSTHLQMPAVMLNILGENGYEGPVKYEGINKSMAVEGVNIHLYGKKVTRPNRKMGHITVVATSLEKAIQQSKKVKQLIKVKS